MNSEQIARDQKRLHAKKRSAKIAQYLLCIAVSAVMLFPMYWLITTSFKTANNVMRFPPQWWPSPWTLKNYITILVEKPFLHYMWNSIYIAALVSFGVVILCSLAGYAFAKIRFRGSMVLFLVVLSGMMMPIEVTIIPIFTALSKMGLANSHFALIVAPMFGYSGAFGTFLMRQFFITVPDELVQAGRLDGASQWTIFTRIILPLATSTIATLVIFTFLQSWNDYLLPLVMLSDSSKYTLPLALKLLSNENGIEWNLVMAAATFSTMPILIVFFCCQKKFMESLSMTGLKG